MYRVEGVGGFHTGCPPPNLSVPQACTDFLISLRAVVLNGMANKTEDLSSLLDGNYT